MPPTSLCAFPQVYVLKRPYVDEFLRRMGELFECVLFTASLAKVPGGRRGVKNREQVWQLLAGPRDTTGKPGLHPNKKHLLFPQYADPVTDLLDRCGVFRARLFRESCVFHQGCYVKDLSRLGRDLRKTLILDNSPASYIFHPENAVSGPDTPTLQGLGESLPWKEEGEGDGGGTMGFTRGGHHPRWTSQPPGVWGKGGKHWRSGDLRCLFPLQVPVQSWFDDMADTEVLNLIPIFEELSAAEDVYTSLGQLRAP